MNVLLILNSLWAPESPRLHHRYLTLGHTNIASGTLVPPLVALPSDEFRLASVPRREDEEPLFSFTVVIEMGDETGDDPCSSGRFLLPPFGEEGIGENGDDFALSVGDVGGTMVIVVGIRNAADGSYFFRINDGFRDAALLGLADVGGVTLSMLSVADMGEALGERRCAGD